MRIWDSCSQIINIIWRYCTVWTEGVWFCSFSASTWNRPDRGRVWVGHRNNCNLRKLIPQFFIDLRSVNCFNHATSFPQSCTYVSKKLIIFLHRWKKMRALKLHPKAQRDAGQAYKNPWNIVSYLFCSSFVSVLC